MFDHEWFEKYESEKIPLNRDLYFVDEGYIDEYEKAMMQVFKGAQYRNVGYVSYASARKINSNSIELSWYPNIYDRFHEVLISLPKDQVVICVGCWRWSEKPRIFVKRAWLEYIHRRSYSIFALIDAIDVKESLEIGKINRERLISLRDKIDSIAVEHQDVAFISFADSLLLKSNWTVGDFRVNLKYTYEPEVFIRLADELNAAYQDVLGLSTYAIIVQGSNEYYDDPLLHLSKSGNHISLNSLGTPFAQLMEIDRAVRAAIKNGKHSKTELYLDEQYYHSLKFSYKFSMDKKQRMPHYKYQTKMLGASCEYFISSRKDILDNLQDEAGEAKP